MAFTPFPWKNKGESSPTKLNRQNLNAAEEAIVTGIGNGEIALPSSVASGGAVTTGNGLVWTGAAWVNANLLTAPGGMVAQDLLVASSSTGVARLAVGTTGQQILVRSDGTVGYAENRVNVLAWKAKADGTTDNTTVINNAIKAINEGGGGCLYFPQSTAAYGVAEFVSLLPKVSFLGDGWASSTIKALSGVKNAVITGTSGNAASDLVIEGLTIDGQYSAGVTTINGIQVTKGARVHLLRSRVTNTARQGVLYSECTGCSVDNECLIEKTGQESAANGFGVLLKAGSENKVHKSRFVACNGMTIGGNTEETNASIVGNHLDKTACPSTITSGAQGAPFSGGIFTVESTTGWPTSGVFSVAGVTGIVTYTGISGNTLTGCTGGTGTATNGGAVLLGYENIGFTAGCTGWVVQGNHSIGSRDNGISCSGARATITGNLIDTCQYHGIANAGNDQTITGNLIRNPGSIGAAQGYAGVALSSTINCIVSSNRIFDDRGGSATMQYGIKETGTAGGHRYGLNRIGGFTSSEYLLLSNTSAWLLQTGTSTQTYSASIGPDASTSEFKEITATNATAFTINAASNPFPGAKLTFVFINSSGGAMATPTMNAIYHLAGALTMPANEKTRVISFYYSGGLTKWIETYRSPADIT